MPGTILLTGADGFTGRHLSRIAAQRGYDVIPLAADLREIQDLEREILSAEFDHVVHLAGVSAVTHADFAAFYEVNVIGSMNLLDALQRSGRSVGKIILASSANIYGNARQSPIAENAPHAPVNHYAMSKLAMEFMASAQYASLPVLFTRPFNYTGVWHDDRFVIPKLVNHFARRAPTVELGNLDVEREFNDVAAICSIYLGLLERGMPGETYNLCSGKTYALREVVGKLEAITGHKIEVAVNPAFLRDNEVHRLCGDTSKLFALLGEVEFPPLEDTLARMLEAESGLPVNQ